MSHINHEQRYIINLMLTQGKTQSEIAQAIGRDKSVVSRELHRNCDKRDFRYDHNMAQRKYEKRKKDKPQKDRFTQEIKEYVESRIRDDLSPDQIVGEAKLLKLPCVSHERIYQHIWNDKRHGGSLYAHLRRHGRRYQKRANNNDNRGIIVDRVDIDQRPPEVEKKERFGDLEIDTIIGRNHKGVMVTMNDRASGLLRISKAPSKSAEIVAKVTVSALEEIKDLLHTITSDNGKEFAKHKEISNNLKIGFYFAKPYHSWERGANENVNGLIRQYFPKKTNFETITDEQVKWVEDKLNNRPRKRFNYLTPNEQFSRLTKVAFTT